jgi:hypothetical protein
VPDENSTPEDSVSRKAHERVTAERDEYKQKAQELERTVRDLHRRDKLVEVFQHSQVGDPWRTASTAMRDVRFRDASEDDLETVASSWLEEIRTVAGAPKSAQPTDDEDDGPPAKPAPPAPWVAPNPASPGESAVGRPMSMASKEFKAWRQGKSFEEIKAAIASGQVTVPRQVQDAQSTISHR